MARAQAFAIATLVVWFAQFTAAQNSGTTRSYVMYVGTYTGPESKGIYSFRFDPRNGKLNSIGLAAETKNPSFLAVDRQQAYLYAVNEISEFKGEKSGSVSAFSINRHTGKLRFLNEVSSRGAGPCHLSLDRTGKHVLVANYDSGSVATFPVLADGKLGEASGVRQHSGRGPNQERQEGPHAHQIQVTPDNRFAIVPDMGLDQLFIYRFESTAGTLAPHDPPFAKVEPGAGPRHFVLHPNGKFVYALNEMGGSVDAFRYHVRGAMEHIQTISTISRQFSGHNDSAEVAIGGGGKFLYASNRGPDTITVFSIDPKRGMLNFVEQVPTMGKTPRNFAIDPTGQYLLAANQESNNIAVFRIDLKSGYLTATGETIAVPSPVCIVFVNGE